MDTNAQKISRYSQSLFLNDCLIINFLENKNFYIEQLKFGKNISSETLKLLH